MLWITHGASVENQISSLVVDSYAISQQRELIFKKDANLKPIKAWYLMFNYSHISIAKWIFELKTVQNDKILASPQDLRCWVSSTEPRSFAAPSMNSVKVISPSWMGMTLWCPGAMNTGHLKNSSIWLYLIHRMGKLSMAGYGNIGIQIFKINIVDGWFLEKKPGTTAGPLQLQRIAAWHVSPALEMCRCTFRV